jgi:DnaJ domain
VARDLYAILGVAHDADFDTIRAAYRNAAKTAHPDLGGTAEEFEALKEAYDCPFRRGTSSKLRPDRLLHTRESGRHP